MIQPNHKHYTLLSILAFVVLVVPTLAYAEAETFWTAPVQTILWNLVVSFFGMLVYIGAAILDFGIDRFVLGFGGTFNNSGIGVAVNNTWGIIRDFVNLFFIFGLVYIGLKMILDSDNSNTRRWLVNLIMAALLVNFSLLATKLVVDFSNQVSAEIAVAGLGAKADGNGKYESNVGEMLMKRMGLTTAFNKGQPSGSGYGYIFGTAILFMISAFVFGAGGILLIVRFAILNLFLVLSPIMFASWILPGLKDTMDRYWQEFLKRCFFAPVYLTFIYFSFQIIGGLQRSVQSNGSGGTRTDLANPNYAGALGADPTQAVQDSTLGTMPFFFLICTFMILSLVAASKLGADGGKLALKTGKDWGNKAQKWTRRGAGTATLGATASLGRNTLGRYGNKLSNDGDLKLRAQQGGISGMKARAALATGRYAAGASFDARQVAGAGKALGIGEGTAGGYKKRIDEDAKKAKKYATDLGTVDIDSEAGKARVAAEQKRIEDEAKEKADMATGSRAAFDESIRVGGDVFDKETAGQKAALAKDEDDLRIGNTDKTLTTREREELETKIKKQKTEVAKREQAVEARTRVREMKNKSIAAQNALSTYSGADAAEKTRLKDLAEKSKAAWDKQQEDERAAFDGEAATAEEERTNAEASAKAGIKYERQIAFIQRNQRSSELWSSKGAKLGGGAGSSVAGGAAGGALGLAGGLLGGGIYAGTGYAAARAKGDSHANIVRELEKEYGKDGTKKMKRDNRVDKKKIEKEADKDIEDAEDKKDGK